MHFLSPGGRRFDEDSDDTVCFNPSLTLIRIYLKLYELNFENTSSSLARTHKIKWGPKTEFTFGPK